MEDSSNGRFIVIRALHVFALEERRPQKVSEGAAPLSGGGGSA
jgi:hypothetical protein